MSKPKNTAKNILLCFWVVEMKKLIIDNTMNNIRKYNNYSNTKILEIKYGLEVLYLTITKTIIISILCIFFGLIKELLLVYLFYGLLRLTGFGLHTKESYQCWIFSSIAFLLIPALIKYVVISKNILVILSLLLLICIIRYAPADTEKRPLIHKKKRAIYKIITSFIAAIYIVIMFLTTNTSIQSTLFYSLLLEVFVIHPLSYKMFNLPYNNYLNIENRKED